MLQEHSLITNITYKGLGNSTIAHLVCATQNQFDHTEVVVFLVALLCLMSLVTNYLRRKITKKYMIFKIKITILC